MLTEYEISAIIGYWRSGADVATIAAIMNTDSATIQTIIDDHLKGMYHTSNKVFYLPPKAIYPTISK